MYWLFPRNFPERLMGYSGKVGVKNRENAFISQRETLVPKRPQYWSYLVLAHPFWGVNKFEP